MPTFLTFLLTTIDSYEVPVTTGFVHGKHLKGNTNTNWYAGSLKNRSLKLLCVINYYNPKCKSK